MNDMEMDIQRIRDNLESTNCYLRNIQEMLYLQLSEEQLKKYKIITDKWIEGK